MPEDLARLWSEQAPRFQRSRDRIAEAGRWRRNEIAPHVPADWGDNPDAFKVILPHATLLSLHTANFLGRRRPAFRRATDETAKSQSASSRVEEWLIAASDQLQAEGEDAWDAEMAYSTHDAEWASLVVPQPAHWDSLLSYTEGTGDQAVIRPRFQRNRDDQSLEDWLAAQGTKDGFRADLGRSARAYQAYARSKQAQTLPMSVRLLPAAMCLPFGIDSRTGQVDALLVRSSRTIVSLQRQGFAWTAVGAGIDPDALGGGSALRALDLYELWTPGRVEYQVASGATGFATTYRDQDSAMIDLAKAYGLTDVPGGYFYGSHWASETDPQNKGVPFLWAFIGLLRGLQQMMSAQVAHAYNVGFGGWLTNLAGLDAANAQYFMEEGRPRELSIKPGKITIVPGPTVPAAHSGSNGDVQHFVGTALELLERMSPTGAILQSAQQSGFAGGVAQSAADNLHAMIVEGARRSAERRASLYLEIGDALARKLKTSIPVKHASAELKTDDLDEDYTVEAYFPTKKGSNLALAQAMYAWSQGDRPVISRREWREDGYGDEQPEQALREIWLERELESERSQQIIQDLTAGMRGDAAQKEREKLAAQGKLSPGGNPLALFPPRPDGQMAGPATGAPPPGMPMPGTGNPAQSAVAGLMGGAIQNAAQSNVIAATGAPVETGA